MGKAHAAANGGIILAMIASGRVESNEQHEVVTVPPLAPEGVAVLPAAGKVGATLQGIGGLGHGSAL